ncbi:tetratricopeptide repeat protein [Arthrobacter sp. SAFR-014]|uniref:tetratricopeptide repeat protein n=1 Tax=unclassified Arthrobacter TaxID=235627 RepID=UPI003F7B7B10
MGEGTADTVGHQSPAFGSVSDSTVTVVYGGQPFAYNLKSAWVPVGMTVRDPSRLLRARAAFVPYLDPAGHIEALRGWLTGSEFFSVRTVGGRGGSGKTRLAVELCRAAREDWATGLLGPFRPESIPIERTIGTDTGPGAPGMLVVIDYAETRTRELEALLPALQRAAGPAHRIRILLLVRRTPRGTDWTDALRTGDDDLDAILDAAARHQVILEEAAWDLDDRQDLFRRSWKAFAERSQEFSGASPTAPTLPDLTAASFGNPLLVAATAYLTVHDPGSALPDTREGLLEGIVSHEASHWTRSAERPKDPDGIVTRRATAMATLAGADSETEGAGLLQHVPDFQETALGVRMAWARWYRHFYPGPRFWNPLEPDLLGEHLIATTLTEFPATLAATIDPARGPTTAQPLIVMARIAATTQTMHAYPGFNAAAGKALQAALPALTLAAVKEAAIARDGLPSGPTIASALGQIVNALSPHLGDVAESLAVLPRHFVPHVNALAVALLQHEVSWLRSHTVPGMSTPVSLARSLNVLSIRLADNGDHDGALHAISEAVEIRRDLATADPADSARDLATSLNTLSNRLTDVNDHDGALQAIREAVGIHRDLALADPTAYTTDLAASLNNLTGCLGRAGDHDGALQAIREAVDIRRNLVAARPAAYSPGLASTLNNLAVCLARTGDRNGALQAVREAVDIRRNLAAAHPAVYTPDLAFSLNSLSVRLAETGDRNGALQAIREAVNIRRDLNAAHPAAYAPVLAGSLLNLSNRLATSGDHDGALETIREAVSIQRELAAAHPAAYNPGLARSLNNLSNRLTKAGDHDGALETIREAVNIRRYLAAAHPANYNPDLAKSLNNLCNLLVDTGDHNGALQAIDEAVNIGRDLAAAHPAVYTPVLARSLRMQAAVLHSLGLGARAESARKEAFRLRGTGLEEKG